jgi:hypothetical protein
MKEAQKAMGSEAMASFRLTPADEFPHRPDAAVNFSESVYVNAFDTATGVGGWMRLGNRVNEGYAELSVCLYLPDGRVACQFLKPEIASNDQFSAGGLRFECIEPFKTVRMTYEGELLLLDDPNLLRDPKRLNASAPRVKGAVAWRHEAMSPMHGGEPTSPEVETMYGRDFSLGHSNQHSRVSGHIRVGDEAWNVEGCGWRDHSWGPRNWQAIHYDRLFMAAFEDGRGLMLLKIANVPGKFRRMGVLLVDGEYEEIVDLDVITEWSASKDPVRVRIGARTARRAEIIEGEVLTVAPLRNRRQVGGETYASRIAEAYTRFTWNGAQAYGMTEYVERLEGGEPVGYPL